MIPPQFALDLGFFYRVPTGWSNQNVRALNLSVDPGVSAPYH